MCGYTNWFLFFSVSLYEAHSVVQAFALTAAVTVSLTMYTMQSKRDFSSWGAGLVFFHRALIICLLIAFIIYHNRLFSVLLLLIMAGFLQVELKSSPKSTSLTIGSIPDLSAERDGRHGHCSRGRRPLLPIHNLRHSHDNEQGHP